MRVRQRIGRFRLHETLASSGLGIIVRALDEETGAECAVRLIHPPCGTGPEDVENFLTVERAVQALGDPHIAQNIAAGVEAEVPFVAREWLAGESLAARLARERRMPELAVLDLAVQAASALAAAHAIGLLHRALAPRNLVFAADGTIRVTDFGASILYDCASSVAHIIWGVPCYLPPERLRFFPEDARSDIYALGAILFHALTGEPPFEGEPQADVLFERLEHEVVRVEKILPDVRATTAEALNHMLRIDAPDRPQTWAETIALLTRAHVAVPRALPAPIRSGIIARPPSEPAPVPVVASATSGSWLTLVMLLAIIGVLGFFAWKTWSPHPVAPLAIAEIAPVENTPPPILATAAPVPKTAPAPKSTPVPPPPPPAAVAMKPVTPAPAPPAPAMFDFTGWQTAKLSKPKEPPVVGDAVPLPDKGALRVTGNTDGVAGHHDTVVFHQREVAGDWTLSARVENVTGGLGGIMVRENLGLSCWCLAITIADSGAVAVKFRQTLDAPAVPGAQFAAAPHGWLRLARHGPRLSAEYSTDNQTWTNVGTLSPPNLASKVTVGFFASGVTKTGSATATFDNLAFTPGK